MVCGFVMKMGEQIIKYNVYNQDAFDSMNSSIQDSLPKECIIELKTYLNDLSLEKLEILLEQLMECIIFSLNCGEGDRDSYQYRYAEKCRDRYNIMFKPYKNLSVTFYSHIFGWGGVYCLKPYYIT